MPENEWMTWPSLSCGVPRLPTLGTRLLIGFEAETTETGVDHPPQVV
jgi:hypothetical protein